MQRAILGAVIGAGIGLAPLACLVLATTGWLLYFYVPVPLALAIGGVPGFYVGRLLDRIRPPLKWFPLCLLLVVLALPLWAIAPVWARQAQIGMMMQRELPIRSDWTLVMRRIDAYAFDNTPGYIVRYQCSDDPSAVLKYLRSELPKRGWQALPVLEAKGAKIHQYRKSGKLLSVNAWYEAPYGLPDSRRWLQMSCCLENLTYRCRPAVGTPVLPGQEYPLDPALLPQE